MLQFNIDLIPTSNILTTQDDSKILKINLNADFQVKVDERRDALGMLIVKIAPLIESKMSSLDGLKLLIATCRSELKQKLYHAKVFTDVQHLISENCSPIDIVLLETIVKYYSIEEARKDIDNYKKDLEDFCKIRIYDVQISGLSSSLLTCDTIKFIVNWKADECTINRIKELLSVAFKDLRKRVQVTRFHEGRSIVVICYAPHHLMDLLLVIAQENIDKLILLGLLRLTIGYNTFYNANNEVSKSVIML